jgi:Fe-S-cluster containining protein
VRNGTKASTVFKKANAIIDQIMASDVNPHMACKRGCNYCCHSPVALTQVEALVIAEAAGLEADCSPGRTSTPDEVGDAPCPFLKNNECSIYEFRPMADDIICWLNSKQNEDK